MSAGGVTGALTVELPVRPPFRLDLTVWALRRRARNEIDRWDGRYHRLLDLEGAAVAVEVAQEGPPEAPTLVATLSGAELTPAHRDAATVALRGLLGLDVDLGSFYALPGGGPRLAELRDRFVGLRPPRFPTLFESFANAVANQQVSLESGLQLLNRLAGAYGRTLPAEAAAAFPGAATVAGLAVPDLRSLGFSASKAGYLLGLAEVAAAGDLEAQLSDAGTGEVIQELHRLRGIGPWSAQYVALRGCGRLDVFPVGDAGARNGLRRRFSLTEVPGDDEVASLVGPWHPFEGLAYFHLLLDGLAERGLVDA